MWLITDANFYLLPQYTTYIPPASTCIPSPYLPYSPAETCHPRQHTLLALKVFYHKSQFVGEKKIKEKKIMSGAPSAIIRFVSHIPLAFMAFNGISLYYRVKKLEVFRILPHGHLFLEGLQMAGEAVRELWKIFQHPA